MGDFGKKLEDLFAAAAFAEGDEPEAARELIAGNKKVLLVLTGEEKDYKSLKYALNIAKRTDAGLEVLATSASHMTTSLIELCEKQAGEEAVDLKVSKKTGCVRKSIVSYARARRDLLCVVIESADSLEKNCLGEDRKLAAIWEKLGCPLALVSGKLESESQ